MELRSRPLLKKAGIAKGTFYYYFKSKEEVLGGLVRQQVGAMIEQAEQLASAPGMSAMEKMRLLITSQNRAAHEQINVESILGLSPVIAKVVEQGVAEGVFHADNVLESVQFVLTGSQFLFDTGLFHWTRDEEAARMRAMQSIIEKTVGAAPGSFGFLTELV